MRLSEIDEFPETVNYERGGKTLSITYDSNAFTSRFFRTLAERARQRYAAAVAQSNQKRKPQRKRGRAVASSDETANRIARPAEHMADVLDIERDIYAEMLSCDEGFIIKDWSATDDEDQPISPTCEVLKRLSARALKELFQFLGDYNRPNAPSPETSTRQTTSGTTKPGSTAEAPSGDGQNG